MRRLVIAFVGVSLVASVLSSGVVDPPIVGLIAPVSAQAIGNVPPEDPGEPVAEGGDILDDEESVEELPELIPVEVPASGSISLPRPAVPLLAPAGTVVLDGDKGSRAGKGEVRLVRAAEDRSIAVVLIIQDKEVTDEVSSAGFAFEIETEVEGAKGKDAKGWELRFSESFFADSTVEANRVVLSINYKCNKKGKCKELDLVSQRFDAETREVVFDLPKKVMKDIVKKPKALDGLNADASAFNAMEEEQGMFFAMAGGTSSSTGNFSAAELTALSTWQVGLQTGHAELSYAVPVPNAPGPVPDVSFSYSSGSVDGMNASTNNQASKVGLGWSDNAPVITRAIRGCPGSYEGNLCLADVAETGGPGLSYRHDGFTLSLNGVGGELIRTTTSSAGLPHPQVSGAKYWEYDLKSKNDWRIRRVEHVNAPASIGNGDLFTTWWEITDGDGTLSVLGRNRPLTLSGGSGPYTTRARSASNAILEGDRRELLSAKVVPVWMPDTVGQQVEGKTLNCGAGANHLCDMAVEWRLDHTIDTTGNMATYHYWDEKNWYVPRVNGNRIVAREYQKSLNLRYIDYGNRFGDGAFGFNQASQVPFRIQFDYRWRNFTDTDDDGDVLSGANWQDTPMDLNCLQTGPNPPTGCTAEAPAFFTWVGLAKVTTLISGQPKASHRLQQKYPTQAGSTETKLWLQKIQRYAPKYQNPTQQDFLPATRYDHVLAVWLDNRVNAPAGVSAMKMPRIGTTQNELGGKVTFTYGQSHPPNSTAGHRCNKGSNNTLGYVRLPCDMYIAFDGDTNAVGAPVLWNKWKVMSAKANAVNGGSDIEETYYDYPVPPDWAYSNQPGRGPSTLTQCSSGYGCGYWNDYRGHSRVEVRRPSSVAGAWERSIHFFATGMRDDRVAPNLTNINQNQRTLGTNPAYQNAQPAKAFHANFGLVNNDDAISGRSLGVRNVNTDRVLLDYTIESYSHALGADGVYVQGYRDTKQTSTAAFLETPGNQSTAQKTRIITDFDKFGRPFRVQNYGIDDSSPADERTHFTTYIMPEYKLLNAALAAQIAAGPWVVSPVQLQATKAGITTDNSWGNWVEASRTNYDDNGYNAIPSFGLVTTKWEQISHKAVDNTPVWGLEIHYDHYATGQVQATTALGGSGTADDQITLYTYHPTYGYLQSTDGPLTGTGDKTIFEADPEYGNVTKTTKLYSPGSLVSTAKYDGFGRIREAKVPSSTVPSHKFTYYQNHAASNWVKTETLRDSSAYTATWEFTDGFGRSIQTHTQHHSNSTAGISATQYDKQGRVKLQTLPTFYSGATPGTNGFDPWSAAGVPRTRTTYPRDIGRGCGRSYNTMTEQLQANGTVWATSYSQMCGTLGRDWDPLDRQTATRYDERGNTKATEAAVFTPDQARTEYVYNVRGDLIDIKNHDGNHTTYTFHKWNINKTSMFDPDLKSITYTYDGHQRVETETDARGIKTTLSYDKTNNPTELESATPGQADATQSTWSYDGSGRITTAVNHNRDQNNATTTADKVTNTYSYNAATGLLAKETLKVGTALPLQTLTYEYRGSGQLKKVSYGDTSNLERERLIYDYDRLERVNKITVGGAGHANRLAAEKIEYDAAGRVIDLWRGNSTTPEHLHTRTVYFDTGKLGWIRHRNADGSIVQNFDYVIDDAGNMERVAEYLGAPGQYQFQCLKYDAMDRLKQGFTTSSGACQSYLANGTDPYSVSYNYSKIGNITSANGQNTPNGTYQYQSGRPHAVSQAGSIAYTYDQIGNMLSRTQSGQPATSYTYGVQNKIHSLDAAGTANDSTYLYDAAGARVKRKTGTKTTHYVGSVEIEQSPAGIVRRLSISGGGQTIGSWEAGQLTTLGADHLGSVGVQRQNDGTTDIQRYLPFGGARNNGVNTLLNDLTFTSQTDDPGTGLMHFGARMYDPQLGRFTQADPLLDGLNRYSYVRNNPLTASDLTGNDCDSNWFTSFVCGGASEVSLKAQSYYALTTVEGRVQVGAAVVVRVNQCSGSTNVNACFVASIGYDEGARLNQIRKDEGWASAAGHVTVIAAEIVVGSKVSTTLGGRVPPPPKAGPIPPPPAVPRMPALNAGPQMAQIGPGPKLAQLGSADVVVIGKIDDLSPGILRPGERTLLPQLQNRFSPRANYLQNDRVLRAEMGRRVPIRDAAVNRVTGGSGTTRASSEPSATF